MLICGVSLFGANRWGVVGEGSRAEGSGKQEAEPWSQGSCLNSDSSHLNALPLAVYFELTFS